MTAHDDAFDDADDVADATLLSPPRDEPDDATRLSARSRATDDEVEDATVVRAAGTDATLVAGSAPSRPRPPLGGSPAASGAPAGPYGRVAYVPVARGVERSSYGARDRPVADQPTRLPGAAGPDPAVLAARAEAARTSAHRRQRRLRAWLAALVVVTTAVVVAALAAIAHLVVQH